MRSRCVKLVVLSSLAVLLNISVKVQAASRSDHPRKISSIKDLHLKAGESFLEVRTRILRLGWKPERMHSNDNYAYDGAEKRLAERGFLEVDSCSIDAGANCILYYRNVDKCLRLDTVGEQVNDMIITRWTDECPIART